MELIFSNYLSTRHVYLETSRPILRPKKPPVQETPRVPSLS